MAIFLYNPYIFLIVLKNDHLWSLFYIIYGKYSKNSNTKASDKMTYANSVDPEGAVWSGSTLFAIPLNI